MVLSAASAGGHPSINYYYDDILPNLNPSVLALYKCIDLTNVCTALIVLS